MNQRAMSNITILMLFELLVVVLIVSIALSVSHSYGNSNTLNKIIYTKDLYLMINTLVAMPGDAVVEFPQNVSAFGFIVLDSEVQGYVAGESQRPELKEHQTLYLPSGYSASGALEGQARICVEKKGTYILLKACN